MKPNKSQCANCGKVIWQSVPNPAYWTHEQNGSDRCPTIVGAKAAPTTN